MENGPLLFIPIKVLNDAYKRDKLSNLCVKKPYHNSAMITFFALTLKSLCFISNASFSTLIGMTESGNSKTIYQVLYHFLKGPLSNCLHLSSVIVKYLMN